MRAQRAQQSSLKLPYVETNFHDLITDGSVYQDRTHHIRQLEATGNSLLLRRFGKSLFLSTLENYYDFAKAEQFERLFGYLAIDPDLSRRAASIRAWGHCHQLIVLG